jgi:hypothetical protein
VVPTLDFDRPDGKGGTWSVRHYFVFHRTLAYVVSFGTTEWHAMFDLFDLIAKTFVVDPDDHAVIASAAYGDAAKDNRLVD